MGQFRLGLSMGLQASTFLAPILFLLHLVRRLPTWRPQDQQPTSDDRSLQPLGITASVICGQKLGQ